MSSKREKHAEKFIGINDVEKVLIKSCSFPV